MTPSALAVARQRAAGHRIEVRVTWEKGDARRFVSEAGEVDLVIAAGGDGTLNEVRSWFDGSFGGCAARFGNSVARDRK